jgi:hypothetical protein
MNTLRQEPRTWQLNMCGRSLQQQKPTVGMRRNDPVGELTLSKVVLCACTDLQVHCKHVSEHVTIAVGHCAGAHFVLHPGERLCMVLRLPAPAR